MESEYKKQVGPYLQALTAKYAECEDEKHKLLSDIISQSRHEITERSDVYVVCDDFDRPESYEGKYTYIHDIIFFMPTHIHDTMIYKIYKEDFNEKNLRKQILDDLNQSCHIEDASGLDIVGDIYFKRAESGPSLAQSTIKEQKQLWGEGTIRVFISHKYGKDVKRLVCLKNALKAYNVASFVAHEDIEPNEVSVQKMEEALSSMHVMIAWLNSGFNESEWTNQEIGIAAGRGIPIVLIRAGENPGGFVGKYQALPGSLDSPTMAKALFILFMREEKNGLKNVAKEAFVMAVKNSATFEFSMNLSKLLPYIDSLLPDQANRLVEAYNGNNQAYNCWDLNEQKAGLKNFLHKVTDGKYKYCDYSRIEKIQPEEPDDIPF